MKPHAASPSLRTRLEVTSLEDRTVPTVVTIAPVSDAYEGGSNGEFTVTRDNTSGPLSVNLSWSGTATEGLFADYFAPMAAAFTGGVASTTISVTGNDHSSTPEPTETVIATIGSGSGYTIGSPSSGTIHLLNNGPDVVSVAALNDAVEGGTDGVLEFTRIGNLSSSLTANISVSGTATSGTDYTSIGNTVTFAANSSVADVNVTALSDNLVEGNETVIATVTSGTGYTIASPPPSATVNITDDPPVVSVTEIDAIEGGPDGSFVLTRTGGDLTSSLTVSYSVGGTATAGTNYTALSGSVTFAAGSDTATVDVAAIDDGIYDPGNTVTATISTTSTYQAGSAYTATVSIGDSASLTFTLDSTAGGIKYDVPWEDVDPDDATQSLALTNFAITVDGYTFTPGTASFTTSPTAEFECGNFVGLTFAIDTSAVSGFGYSSIYMSGDLTLNAVQNGTSTLFQVTADMKRPALLIDFSTWFTGANNVALTVRWKLNDTTDESTVITIPSGTSGADVRDLVFSVLQDNNLGVTALPDGRLLVKGTAKGELTELRISVAGQGGTWTGPGFVGKADAGAIVPKFYINGVEKTLP